MRMRTLKTFPALVALKCCLKGVVVCFTLSWKIFPHFFIFSSKYRSGFFLHSCWNIFPRSNPSDLERRVVYFHTISFYISWLAEQTFFSKYSCLFSVGVILVVKQLLLLLLMLFNCSCYYCWYHCFFPLLLLIMLLNSLLLLKLLLV